jgi:hypothetical protein
MKYMWLLLSIACGILYIYLEQTIGVSQNILIAFCLATYAIYKVENLENKLKRIIEIDKLIK